jgi:hypothetical protein
MRNPYAIHARKRIGGFIHKKIGDKRVKQKEQNLLTEELSDMYSAHRADEEVEDEKENATE